MLIDVRGHCPACGAEKLHVVKGVGLLHCLNPECTHQGAAQKILDDPEVHHILEVLPDVETEQSGRWTLKHPLVERIDGDLFNCSLHQMFSMRFALHFPPDPGRYRVIRQGQGWSLEEL